MTKRPNIRKNNAGMTLIELVFAAGVLAVAISTMVGALLTLTVMGDVAEGRTQATTALAGVMDRTRAAGPSILTEAPAPLVIDGKTMAISMEIINTSGTNIEVPIALDADGNLPTLPDPLEVMVTIMWEDNRGRVYTTRSATILGN
jgi:type II secretory pathway pseudopilin PulG